MDTKATFIQRVGSLALGTPTSVSAVGAAGPSGASVKYTSLPSSTETEFASENVTLGADGAVVAAAVAHLYPYGEAAQWKLRIYIDGVLAGEASTWTFINAGAGTDWGVALLVAAKGCNAGVIPVSYRIAVATSSPSLGIRSRGAIGVTLA